ncbi:MAG: hypothetical protein E7599_02700 [Ruminococcaceae bacterium]|nr:hypothetical protein [Oscillospiraceae bacterium]
MNEEKKIYSIGPNTLIMAISAIGVLISFLMALNGKRKKLATVAFLVSFGGLVYGTVRHFGMLKKEEEELLTIELEDDEEKAETDA